MNTEQLIERLDWEADNRGLPPFDGWGWLHEAAARLREQEAEIARLEAALLDAMRGFASQAELREKAEAELTEWKQELLETTDPRYWYQQAKSLRADAERYRWLRDVGDSTWVPLAKRINDPPMTIAQVEAHIDAAIDAARSAK